MMTSDEKLLLLATRLRDVPVENFDLETWGWVTAACDTICCAVGHATFIPEFRALGLGNMIVGGEIFPTYKDYEDHIEVACAFFEINFQQFLHLFTEDSYIVLDNEQQIMPWQVSNQIEEFVTRRNAKIVPKKISALPLED